MKKFFFIALAMTITFVGMAQRLAVRWNEKYKAPEGQYQNLQFIKAAPTNEDAVIAIYRKINPSLFDNDYVLVKMNSKLDPSGEQKLDYPANGSEGMIDILKLKQTNYLLEYKVKGDKYAELYLTPINLKTFKKEISTKKIADIAENDLVSPDEVAGSKYSIFLDVVYSPDSSKLLLNYYSKFQASKSMYSIVLNNSGQIIYTANHTWEQPADHIQMQKPAIDNDGKVYFMWRTYSQSFSKDVEKGEGDQIPSYTSQLLVVDKEKKNNYTFETDGKYLHDMMLGYDKNKKPLVVGTFKEKYNGRLKGVFITPPIGEASAISNITFSLYPPELQDRVDADMELKKLSPGLTNDFYVGSVMSTSDGTNYMVSEFFKLTNMENAFIYEKGDFVVTTFTNDGKVVYQGLPRRQYVNASLTSDEYLAPNEFLTLIVDNKLVLLYNDSEENSMQDIKEKIIRFTKSTKSVVLASTINTQGKLLSRKIVFNHLDLEGYIFNYRLCSMRTNMYAIFAAKPQKANEGVMAGLMMAR